MEKRRLLKLDYGLTTSVLLKVSGTLARKARQHWSPSGYMPRDRQFINVQLGAEASAPKDFPTLPSNGLPSRTGATMILDHRVAI